MLSDERLVEWENDLTSLQWDKWQRVCQDIADVLSVIREVRQLRVRVAKLERGDTMIECITEERLEKIETRMGILGSHDAMALRVSTIDDLISEIRQLRARVKELEGK